MTVKGLFWVLRDMFKPTPDAFRGRRSKLRRAKLPQAAQPMWPAAEPAPSMYSASKNPAKKGGGGAQGSSRNPGHFTSGGDAGPWVGIVL